MLPNFSTQVDCIVILPIMCGIYGFVALCEGEGGRGVRLFELTINYVIFLVSFIFQVLKYEVPLIVLAALSLVSALVIPVTGLIFCCCRCRGKCGGDVQAKMVRHPTKARCWYTTGLLLCAFFLMYVELHLFIHSTP